MVTKQKVDFKNIIQTRQRHFENQDSFRGFGDILTKIQLIQERYHIGTIGTTHSGKYLVIDFPKNK